MRKVIIIFTLFLSQSSLGQICIHQDLSKLLTYKIDISRIKRNNQFDSCIINLSVIKKSNKITIQKIEISSDFMIEEDFNRCDHVRSYFTNKNIKNQVIDNDFGDLIVADFNFDKKEDFAIKYDSGGNGGPFYSFFIQDTKGKFIRDKYLSEVMVFFPQVIDIKKKTLTTIVHANAFQQQKTTYKLVDKKWKVLESILIQ